MPAHDQFIGEMIQPDRATFDTARMAAGEPGLPRRFTWRGQSCEVAVVLRAWRETSPCRHGSGERYVCKHWYEVRLTTGVVARIYFERQARVKPRTRRRWCLFSLSTAKSAEAPDTDGVSSPPSDPA